MQQSSKTSSCAENVLFSKRKEKINRNCMTSHSFSYCEHFEFCSQRFFSSVAAREAAPSYIYPQSYCLSSATKWKFKKCSTTRKGPHFAEKVLFSKKKKKKRKNETWRPRPHIPSHIASAAACAFFCCCSARSARSCPSGRFSLLLASRCSFKILLQYPWKLQRFAYKKPNLAAVWPGPKYAQTEKSNRWRRKCDWSTPALTSSLLQKLPLYLFFTKVQNIKKWPKIQNKGEGDIYFDAFFAVASWPVFLQICSQPPLCTLHSSWSVQELVLSVLTW